MLLKTLKLVFTGESIRWWVTHMREAFWHQLPQHEVAQKPVTDNEVSKVYVSNKLLFITERLFEQVSCCPKNLASH